MHTFLDLYRFLNEQAPYQYQEDYDNSGLLVGRWQTQITGVLVSLDCTEVIIDEAVSLGANLVVCHHPIVFRGLKRFNEANYVERTIAKAIKQDIGILAIHTNLDNVRHGVNDRIASRLGLANGEILMPRKENTAIGAGLVGTLVNAMDTASFLTHLKSTMEVSILKSTEWCHDMVSKVAVCGGSGSFLIAAAKRAGAQVYITSDIKYHEFFDADDEIIIMDIGHYESEKFTIDLLYALISNNFSNFAAHCTKVSTNPVKYL